MISRRRLAMCLVMAAAVPAAAQPKDKDPTAIAKEYVDAGIAAQKSGDFDFAVSNFEKAYAVSPHPVLLFNIAQAHRLAMAASKDPDVAAHHRDAAREAYRKFLDTHPNGD